MTFEKLQQIIEENSIPHKATVDGNVVKQRWMVFIMKLKKID
ncbi:hypothetical protein HMPREF1215_00795 [Coprococcus sp. HPP0074]|nr:hypothetical protein HMPREF1215_00795 [Coprococcus sp. HPP0074]